jgi:hypothetical protein
MDAAIVKENLIAVIAEIQTASGLDCPPLDGVTRPVGAVPKFDSKIWPVATTILAEKIKVPIPDDVNIFYDEATKLPRSIDEMVAYVCQLAEKQKKEETVTQ